MADEYHAHEALHVAHVLQNMVAHELEGHPFVTEHPAIAAQVEEVQRELGKLYQAIGAIHHEADPKPRKQLRFLTAEECHELAETVGLGSVTVQRKFCEVNGLPPPVIAGVMVDGAVIGIDNDGNAICWNAETKQSYNSGEPPTDEERTALGVAIPQTTEGEQR